MPYILLWEPHGVYKKFTGVVTGAELVQSVIEVANDIRFADARYEISDYLAAERTDFSQDALNEVRAVRIGSISRNPSIRVAIVTLDDEIQQRIYSTIAARLTLHQTKVFSALPEAEAWVGRMASEPA
jgi:hypothetical protein